MFSTYNLLEFGKRIRAIRVKNHLTQQQVNEITGINENTLRRIENGYVIPRYNTLEILSNIYKCDLLLELSNHRSDNNLLNYYHLLDKIVLSNDLSQFNKLEDEYISFTAALNQFDYININELEQFKIFLSISKKYFTVKTNQIEILIDKLVISLRNSIVSFDINNLNQNNYTPFEIRIIILISLLYVKLDNIDLSTKLLTFCLEYLIELSIISNDSIKLILKLYFNIAYNYQRTNNYDKAYINADLGVKYAISHDSTYCLAQLLYRKGAAEFRLDIKDYANTLRQSIELLLIKSEIETANIYCKIIKENYFLDFYGSNNI